jgi:hypothetical protein
METKSLSSKTYEPPDIEVIEIKFEAGFASSTNSYQDGGEWS